MTESKLDHKIEEDLETERLGLLQQLENLLEWPMVVLAMIWLGLLVIELSRGLSPSLEMFSTVIRWIFVVEFVIKFILAPHKLNYLKRKWLTILSLAIPAVRIFRIARVTRVLSLTRAARALKLFKLVSSLNRGIRSLGRITSRRGLKYVLLVTVVVIAAGAAGMQAFEQEHGIRSYGDALWWTTMIITTLGSDYWPRSGEGRILCLLLSIYAFTVFGYMTASLASVFIDQDKKEEEVEQLMRIEKQLETLLKERRL